MDKTTLMATRREIAMPESERVKRVYQARQEKGWEKRYSWYQGGTLQAFQERECVLLKMLERTLEVLGDKRILDIGCGSGNILIPFLLYGAKMENCFGVDILQDRIEAAKKRLPGMTFACCSGENIPFKKGIFDLFMMFTCLSRWARKRDFWQGNAVLMLAERLFGKVINGSKFLKKYFFAFYQYNSLLKSQPFSINCRL